MTNEELKKKIAQIIADYFCPQGNEHKKLWGDDRLCYSKMNFAECEWVTECTDALIAAGIVDKSDYASMKETAVRYKAEVSKAESRAKEAEHRAEVAEKALKNACEDVKETVSFLIELSERVDGLRVEGYLPEESEPKAYINRAEKELAEEEKE